MPRPKGHIIVPPEDKKTEVLRLRISKKDKQLINDYCLKNNIDVSEYVRSILLSNIKAK